MDSRHLPQFDNHYSNATLVDNWREDRLFREQVGERRAGVHTHPFSLSGASPQQAQRDEASWYATVSTYTDAHGQGGGGGHGEGVNDGVAQGRAADMCRPHEMQRELLLGSQTVGEETPTGDPMSAEWGAFWRATDRTAVGVGGQSASVIMDAHHSTEAAEARSALLSSTAAARQQSHVRNLYESNHQQASRPGGPLSFTGTGSPALYKTLDNTQGRVRAINKETGNPGELEPDEIVADRFATTKASADAPIQHFYFQRKLPPPTH